MLIHSQLLKKWKTISITRFFVGELGKWKHAKQLAAFFVSSIANKQTEKCVFVFAVQRYEFIASNGIVWNSISLVCVCALKPLCKWKLCACVWILMPNECFAYQMLRNDYKFHIQMWWMHTMVTISPFLRILIQINSFLLSPNVFVLSAMCCLATWS